MEERTEMRLQEVLEPIIAELAKHARDIEELNKRASKVPAPLL